MTRWKLAILLGSLLIVLGLGGVVHGEMRGAYTGYTPCEGCHSDIVAAWKATPHAAKAFDALKIQGEGKPMNSDCFQCHTVGYKEEGGFVDITLTPDLKNVQCESCHGPRRKHTELGRKHSESMSAEDIQGKPEEATCRKCHTPRQDKNFDFAKKSKLVHPH